MSSQDNQFKNVLQATAAGTFLGISVLLMIQKYSYSKAQNRKIESLIERKKRQIEKKQIENFLNDAEEIQEAEKKGGDAYAKEIAIKLQNKQGKKERRRVELCFNENDEMVEKYTESSSDDIDILNMDVYDAQDLKKIMKQKKNKYTSKVFANLGNQEYNHGKAQITFDIFDGKDKTQNAEVFIENLENTKKRHMLETQQKLKNQVSLKVEQDFKVENDQIEGNLKQDFNKKSNKIDDPREEVIFDVNPQNFQKKDHVFMDFFSMYGKTFIDKKKVEQGKQSTLKDIGEYVKSPRKIQTDNKNDYQDNLYHQWNQSFQQNLQKKQNQEKLNQFINQN